MARNRNRDEAQPTQRGEGAGADAGATEGAAGSERAEPAAPRGRGEYEPCLVRLYHPAFEGEPRTGVVTGVIDPRDSDRSDGQPRISAHCFFRPRENMAPSPREFADIPLYLDGEEPKEAVYARGSIDPRETRIQ